MSVYSTVSGVSISKLSAYINKHSNDSNYESLNWGVKTYSGILFMGKFIECNEKQTDTSTTVEYVFEEGILTNPNPITKVFVLQTAPVNHEKTQEIIATIEADEAAASGSVSA